MCLTGTVMIAFIWFLWPMQCVFQKPWLLPLLHLSQTWDWAKLGTLQNAKGGPAMDWQFLLLFWGWSWFFSGKRCIRLATSRPLLLSPSSKTRGQSPRDKVLGVSDLNHKRFFPAAKPTGQGRIIGKDFRKSRSAYSFLSTATSNWA